MTWFVLGLLAPVLYSVANHTDKYLITRHLKEGGTGALTIFSSLFSLAALAPIGLASPSVFGIAWDHALALALNGMLTVVAVLCYFAALHRDEASYVVPFYQTIPMFAFGLGYVLLGETITALQALACVVIIVGALVLSFDLGDKVRFKAGVVMLMLCASLCYALNGVIFKMIAIDLGFWTSLAWTLVGRVVAGLALLAFVAPFRRQFVELFHANAAPVIGLNAISETFYLTADAVSHYATMLASVVLVFSLNSLQPLLVFVLGVLLSAIHPALSQEALTRRQLVQKGVGIGTILLGTTFIGV